MTLDIMINLKSVYFHENSAEHLYQANIFAMILFFYFGSESIFEAVVPRYHVTVKNIFFYHNKKSKSVTLPRGSFVCMIQYVNGHLVHVYQFYCQNPIVNRIK